MAPARPATAAQGAVRAPGGPIRKRNCYFCREKVDEVDYKNVNQLRRYVSEKGKIRSRRITGACRRHQRQVAVAVKRAREMALLPYVDRLMEVILRQDVDKVGLRGEVVDVAPRLRAQLPAAAQARRDGDPGQGRRAAQARGEARSARGAELRAGAGDRAAARGERAPLRRARGRHGIALRLRHGDRRRRARLGEREGARRPPQDRLADSIKRIGRYQIPIELFEDVTVDGAARSSSPRAASCRPRRSSTRSPQRKRRPRPPHRPRRRRSTSRRRRRSTQSWPRRTRRPRRSETPDAAEEPRGGAGPGRCIRRAPPTPQTTPATGPGCNKPRTASPQAGRCLWISSGTSRSERPFHPQVSSGGAGNLCSLMPANRLLLTRPGLSKCRRPDLPRPRRE